MSGPTCAPNFNGDDGDDRINKLVRYGRYASDTRDHLLRMCELIADGDEALRADLLLVVEVLWV